MIFGETIDLAILIFATAVLYAAVGQAGATGYLAAMGLVGLAPAVMKPTALALNLLVAAIGTINFARAGHFRWRTFYPFAVLGVPFSFVDGAITIPPHVYYPLVGALLLVAASCSSAGGPLSSLRAGRKAPRPRRRSGPRWRRGPAWDCSRA